MTNETRLMAALVIVAITVALYLLLVWPTGGYEPSLSFIERVQNLRDEGKSIQAAWGEAQIEALLEYVFRCWILPGLGLLFSALVAACTVLVCLDRLVEASIKHQEE